MARCSSCGADIPSSSVAADLDLARCPSCGALVDLRERAKKAFVAAARPALAMPIPEGWLVDESGGGIKVRWRWFTLPSLVMIPFALFWNGILFAMAAGVTDGGKHPERLLFGLVVPHVWVGVGLLYYLATTFLNSTYVEAGVGSLLVRIGPLPWWHGNKDFAAGELEQLFVLEHRGKNSTNYELCAAMRDGRKQSVVKGIDSEDQARFLETRLERVLGITDRPVEGELRPARSAS